MPRKKREIIPLTPIELNDLWAEAALPSLPASTMEEVLAREDLPKHLGYFLQWFNQSSPKTSDEMYCFILYDIENNKVRRMVSKYLEKQGCIRVQKSVFFARITHKMHKQILGILRKAQGCYENEDSIMVLPVGEEMLHKLSCIGKNFELDLMTAPKHTIIF